MKKLITLLTMYALLVCAAPTMAQTRDKRQQYVQGLENLLNTSNSDGAEFHCTTSGVSATTMEIHCDLMNQGWVNEIMSLRKDFRYVGFVRVDFFNDDDFHIWYKL